MPEDETKKEKGWTVALSIVDETQPPMKVFNKGKETLDLYQMLASIKNDLEKLQGLL